MTMILYQTEVHVPTQAGAVLILLTKTVAINVVTLAYFRWLCMLVHA
eukprot:CAMPEP_0174368632 /NCGR_PEP_ID=MMETSP0811_2-20130205/89822_1 /TAXON_ID=73025 ORGANISM="Eutreptiella gymnastica-like, Strain CCMP1594" /NCGR_SAMPLE_ID=MMETSP0811_2 /ASSEMBLY_ACC=CAM_ASM_000667 /LENGTH=46 /DNA_ID= /DNA_START= /DNA_END= /DNA_ORIENTATION=